MSQISWAPTSWLLSTSYWYWVLPLNSRFVAFASCLLTLIRLTYISIIAGFRPPASARGTRTHGRAQTDTDFHGQRRQARLPGRDRPAGAQRTAARDRNHGLPAAVLKKGLWSVARGPVGEQPEPAQSVPVHESPCESVLRPACAPTKEPYSLGKQLIANVERRIGIHAITEDPTDRGFLRCSTFDVECSTFDLFDAIPTRASGHCRIE